VFAKVFKMEKERELAGKRKHAIDANAISEVLTQKKRKLIQEELESEEENQVSFILSQIQDPIKEEKATISTIPKTRGKKNHNSLMFQKLYAIRQNLGLLLVCTLLLNLLNRLNLILVLQILPRL